MTNRPILQLAKHVPTNWDPEPSKPWFIIETYITSEGVRTRVCSGRWKTESEAKAALIERQKAMDE